MPFDSLKRVLIPLTVFILGLISIGILILTNRIHEQLHQVYFLNDVNHEVQIAMLAAHHGLEEMTGVTPSIDMDDILYGTDFSIGTFELMLAGGKLRNKEIMHPLTDSIIKKIKSIISIIKKFKRAVINIRDSRASPAVDIEHDQIFIDYMSETVALNKLFEELQDRYEGRIRISFLIILILWSGILLTAVSGLSVVETRRRRSEEEQSSLRKRLEAQWELARMVDVDIDSIYDRILAEMIDMTESRYGFYGLLNEDESVMTTHICSKETIADSKIDKNPIEFNVAKLGVWGNAVRERRILINNNYHKDDLNKKGVPGAGVAINRLMAVPFFKSGRIVAIGAVANKTREYTEKDAQQMNSFLHSAQMVQDKRKAEEELKSHREHLAELVEERTHALQKMNEELELEISERGRAEKEVKKMALFAEMNPSPVIRIDMKGQILMANQAAAEILNMVSLTGLHISSVIPEIEILNYAVCIRDGSILPITSQIGDRFFHFTLRGLPDLGIGQIYGSDITDQKKAEIEILRAGQLASVGELAAGVAHEINNPINGIINFAQIVSDKTSKGSMENDAANQIIKEGDRIAGIVSSLLSFARNSRDEKRPVHIREVLEESLSLIKAQIRKEGILLTVKLPSKLPAVSAHFQQLEQVCLNLINNARYTLNEKYPGVHENKILEIVGEKKVIDERDYVRVTFFDHGNGIPEELLNKIMNPFFTTKPGGGGTGLGLSISQGIISRHGGHLKLDSIEGQYTKVIMELPSTVKERV